MVTVFDLITGETEQLTAKAAPRRMEPSQKAVPHVLPRLQEHTFAEPQQRETLPWPVAHLNCEAFIQSMQKR